MVVNTKPQHRKKEESEWLRGERDQIKFIDLRIESALHMTVTRGFVGIIRAAKRDLKSYVA